MRKLFTFLVLLSAIVPAYADTPILYGGVKDNQVISVSNIPEDKRTSGVALDVVTFEDLKDFNNPDLTQVFNDIPGVTIQRSGSQGDVTSFRIRGTDRVKVMMDGVRADNPADGKFYLENYFSDDIERIEVLKGPQAGISGVNASGGMVSLKTRQGHGPIKFETDQQGGNLGTYKQHYSLSGGDDKKDFYFGIGSYQTDGGTRINDNLERVRNDSYRNFNFASNLGLRLFKDKGELRNITRYINSRKGVGINGFGDFIQQDPNDYSTRNEFMNVTSFDYDTGKVYSTTNRFGIYTYRYNFHQIEDDYDMGNGLDYIGSNRVNFNTQHNFKYKNWNTFSVGYTGEYNKFNTISDYRDSSWPSYDKFDGSISQHDFYLHDVINIKDKLFIRGGARFVHNSEFGNYILPNVSAAYIIKTPKLSGEYTKIRASYGLSANMPTLYQRYAKLNGMLEPNSNLSAEKLSSWDVGVEQTFFNQKLTLEGTYFNSKYSDYIGWYSDPDTYIGHYINVDSAKVQGFEFGANYKLLGKVKLFTNYTFSKSQNNETGYALVGVPTHRINGGIVYKPHERVTLFAKAEYSSERNYSGNNKVDGYVDVSAGLNARLLTYKRLALDLKAQVYNLLNSKQAMYKNYYQPGIHYMVGLNLKWTI